LVIFNSLNRLSHFFWLFSFSFSNLSGFSLFFLLFFSRFKRKSRSPPGFELWPWTKILNFFFWDEMVCFYITLLYISSDRNCFNILFIKYYSNNIFYFCLNRESERNDEIQFIEYSSSPQRYRVSMSHQFWVINVDRHGVVDISRQSQSGRQRKRNNGTRSKQCWEDIQVRHHVSLLVVHEHKDPVHFISGVVRTHATKTDSSFSFTKM